MNIFMFEIKKSLKSFYIWTISIILTLIILMGAMYPVYLDSKDEVLGVLKNFPPQFTEAFGFNVDTIFTFGGFYSFAFVYIGIIGGIMAVAIAVSTFAREKKSKCTDFLLTKPVSRKDIFKYKLVSNLAILIVTNVIYVLSTIIIYSISKDTGISLGTLILGSLSLFLTQVVFMSLGVFFAIFSKKIRSVAGIATAFGFGAFIISAIVNVVKEEFLNYLSPLKYFEPTTVFLGNGYQIKYVVIAIIIVIACLGVSFIKYTKEDTFAI